MVGYTAVMYGSSCVESQNFPLMLQMANRLFQACRISTIFRGKLYMVKDTCLDVGQVIVMGRKDITLVTFRDAGAVRG